MRSMAFSADGQRLAVGHFFTESQPATLRVWDLDKGREIRSFAGHTQVIASVAFSPDGKSFLTASWDKTCGFGI
jgi:WD40 repeat protein